MKRILVMLVVISIVLTLFSCGKATAEEQSDFDVEQAIESKLNGRVIAYCVTHYDNVRLAMVDSFTFSDNGDGTYDCKGYVLVVDDYTDHYKGKFNATVEVDVESESVDCIDFNMETPTLVN